MRLPDVKWKLPQRPLLAALAAGGAIGAVLVFAITSRPRASAAQDPSESAALVSAAVQTSDLDASIDGGEDGEHAEADAAPPAPPVWRVASLKSDPGVQIVDGTVGHRTFLDALGALGLSKNESYRLIRAFNAIHHFERCDPKDAITIAKDRATGRLVGFEYATSPIDVWQARRDDAGELDAKKLELTVERRRVAVAIAVGDDLRQSIVQAGLDDDLLKMLDDALDGHAELADVRPGARLRIIATEERIDGAFVQYAELDAVEYTPANPSASPVRVYYFGRPSPLGAGTTMASIAPSGGRNAKTAKDGKEAKPAGFYYDAKGRQPYHGGWRSPVPLARIASRFNPRRMHPVLHVIMPHNGVDFAAPPGTPVYATASGTVKIAGDGGPCGNMVQITHANGLVSAYCHLSRFAAGLHAGQHVDTRQLVGYVGSTGRTTGPHLHFAIKRGEAFLDPLGLKLDGVRVVPLADRAEFDRERAELDLALNAIPLPEPVASDAGAPASDVDGGLDETVFEESP